MTQQSLDVSRPAKMPLVLAALASAAVLVWAYWPTFLEMAQKWEADPQYSHGWLVPGFALALLWLRRDKLKDRTFQLNAWGVPVLALGIAMRLAGAIGYFVWLDQVSLLPTVFGLFLTLGGWTALRWSWPAVLFLFFMVPLPHRVEHSLADPLQRLATTASTYVLQTVGMPAIAEGNTILLNDVTLNIVEACSGLRMLMIFFALSTGFVLLIRRPLWEKCFIAASAVPIALVVNILRITATGILHETAGTEVAKAVFHDLAGWLMMPVALCLLGLEMSLLKNLLLDPPAVAGPAPVAFGLRNPSPASATQREGRRASRRRRGGAPLTPPLAK